MALKLFVNSESMGEQLENKLTMYKRVSTSVAKHPGRGAVREPLDSFDVVGPDGCHRCLVHPPSWESVLTFLRRNPVRRLPAPVLAFVLRRVFLALDFLHTGCEIIHTGACKRDLTEQSYPFSVTHSRRSVLKCCGSRYQSR